MSPNCQERLGAGQGTAHAEDSKDEHDASTVKHSDQGTIGMPSASTRDAWVNPALPPHLRKKMNENDILNRTDDGDLGDESSSPGMPLERRENPGHTVVVRAETTNIPLDSAPGVLTGQSTISGDVSSRAELEPPERSHPREALETAHGSSRLPPHLRGKPSYAGAASHTKPTEADSNPSPSLSTEQSTPEPMDSGRDTGMRGLSHAGNNFGVAESIQNYVTIKKSHEALPPHLRGKREANSKLPANPGVVDVARKPTPVSPSLHGRVKITDNEVSDHPDEVALKPMEADVGAFDMVDEEEDDIELGIHDPSHPKFDARSYRCEITGRFHCPFPACG